MVKSICYTVKGLALLPHSLEVTTLHLCYVFSQWNLHMVLLQLWVSVVTLFCFHSPVTCMLGELANQSLLGYSTIKLFTIMPVELGFWKGQCYVGSNCAGLGIVCWTIRFFSSSCVPSWHFRDNSQRSLLPHTIKAESKLHDWLVFEKTTTIRLICICRLVDVFVGGECVRVNFSPSYAKLLEWWKGQEACNAQFARAARGRKPILIKAAVAPKR